MATPMSMSGLPALMVTDHDALNITEAKKFDVIIPTTDHDLSVGSQQHTTHLHGEPVEEGVEANSDAGERQNRPEDSQKQTGLKPHRSHADKKSTEYDPARFRESLEKGIPIESGNRSVYGFGLSDVQEDALYQYITNKSGKRPPGYKPDREALADCWGSPEPEREDNSDREDDIPVVFSADLSQTLPTTEPSVGENSETVVKACGEAGEEKEEEDEVDVASTESLYEGEGGVDLGARSAGRGVDATGDVGDVGDGVKVCEADAEAMDEEELTDRLLIMQKVKECYGLGVKTSLERVMRKGEVEPFIIARGSLNSINLGTCESMQEAPLVQEDNNVVSPTTSKIVEDGSFTNLWEDECMRYLERAPEFRARLHYEVRVILISPAFHIAGSTVTAFAHIYEKKFGRTIDSVGFSTAARLCRSMPHVVQRALLIDEGKLQLVDTPKNHRIVAGIRSGLRRIVYDIIKSHQGIDLEAIEALCNRMIGQPINEVLIDHGYQTLSIECLLQDMPDIVYLDEHTECTRVYLCNGAEDPAITDGLLTQRPSQDECFESMSQNNMFNKSGNFHYSKLLERQKPQSLDDGDVQKSIKSPKGPRSGPNGMALEELSDLRVLCAAESSSPYTDVSIYTIEDVSPHIRLRFRLLLTLHDDGHGIEIEDLPSVYEKMFGMPLDLSTLGFDSLQELIDAWKDVILTKASNDGWVFPINTLENNRILNTITSGLRSTVFAILLARYPDGLEPLELVECLEETLSGKLWEILRSNGYIFRDINNARIALSKGPSNFQLAKCSELRLLLKDMEDFVRLGCREDGVLIVKLRDGDFPLLDLFDCEVSKESMDGKDEQSYNSIHVNAMKKKQIAKDLLLNSTTKASDDVIMAMDNQLPSILNSKDLKAMDKLIIDGNIRNERLTPLMLKSFIRENLASPSTSPVLLSEVMVALSKQTSYPPHKLIHEIRMIFGSPKYMENGLTVEEFCTTYRKRTSQPICLGEFQSVESLLRTMPNIVSFELQSVSNEQMITLIQSRQNMRILSVVKAGLRQVLFWAMLKNPGGIWKELLEGWYLDFTGCPLSSTLASHGYDKPHQAPLEPIIEFLQDMADILALDEDDSNLYIWVGPYKDPISLDASLLGIPVETIQYVPFNKKNENSR